MKRLGIFVLSIILAGLSLNGCLFSTYQTARTVGKGHISFGGCLEGGKVIWKEEHRAGDIDYEGGDFLWTEYWLRYGLFDKLDLSVKFFQPIGCGIKWQFLGSKESAWATAIIGEYQFTNAGTPNGHDTHINDICVSILVSKDYELKEKTYLRVTPYFSPRFIFRRTTVNPGTVWSHLANSQLIGFNIGLNVAKET